MVRWAANEGLLNAARGRVAAGRKVAPSYKVAMLEIDGTVTVMTTAEQSETRAMEGVKRD